MLFRSRTPGVTGDTPFIYTEVMLSSGDGVKGLMLRGVDPRTAPGVLSMLKWEDANRDKAGIASESISRHSVTYVDQTEENTTLGFPAMLTGFLQPYMRARFGRGAGQ